MSFRHVVALQWKPETSADQRATIAAALRELPTLIPTIRSYVVGEDAAINDGNHDLVVVADFDDADGYLVYRDHPEHQRVIRDHIAPYLAARAAVQHAM
jgi:Stress responsive A/B Barrel Domain